MGLLDKALTLETEKNAEIESSLHFNPNLESLYNRLNTSTKGLDFPSLLFGGLVNELQIQKGALLLPDESHVFTPWAVEGFDQTTSRRIRIPDSLLPSLNKEHFNYVELQNTEIDLLKDFFSFREYSVTSRVILVPLKNNSQVIAVLFITEGNLLNQDRRTLNDLFENISRTAGSLLKEKRDSILLRLEDVTNEHNDISTFLKERISSDSSPFLLLSLKLDSFMDKIKSNDRNSVEFRMIEDILRLVKTLLGGRGSVTIKDSRSLYVLLGSSRQEEAELFIHQIGLSLSYFYKLDNSLFKPVWKMVRFPEDGSSEQDLIQQLEK
ncbi:hypothetical protein [Spirochaeta isovalerica]|uniref:GGDEF domain-containing protein n=1 Tax=Spirochaeta isovalerica TaxID=150 RepID=A0A841R8U8_9SPIO|nr:hypothetical protein [Spirochaeta isovalerica]MBB6478902.1 hypothetical protein [Spirochaeta isovalerica]